MPSEAQSDRADVTPTVTVRGQAAVRAAPDEAMLALDLTALYEAPGPALADVARRTEALIALLDELNVAKGDRSTTGVTVYEAFDRTKTGRRSLGHRASARVLLRLADPDTIGDIITRATTELDAEIDGPRWRIAPDNPVVLRAASEAAADARRKAKAYAEGAGARIERLLRLAEASTHGFAGGSEMVLASAAPPDPSMGIERGEHEIVAAVEATFALALE